MAASSQRRPVRVLLADDHVVMREALCVLLGEQAGIEVAGEASNGREAVLAVQRLKPDVVLMDLVMPGLNGLEAARQVTRGSSGARVVMLSGYADESRLLEAVRAGAVGFLRKSCSAEELVLAVETVARGNHYFSDDLITGLDVASMLYRAHRSDGPRPADALSPREREVLQLIAESHTNQEIADELVLSVKTVEAHNARIMEKLALRRRGDLIRYAIRNGIVSLETPERADDAGLAS